MHDDKHYILIAEDDIEVRSTMELYLEQTGFNVIGVSDGVEVIRVVIEMWPVPPMVLVTNIEMPHMDGRLLLSLFAVVERKEWRNLPVIITTGSEHFFSDKYPVLRKPYSLERLLELVMEHAKR